MANTADALISVLESWIGYSEYNGKHKTIIDIYNNHKPLALGYKVKYTDSWCDVTVSAGAIKSNNVDIIGTECGCERHIAIFKEKGIWIEDGTITPKRGDIILYNWDDSVQPNDGFSDHIGVVVSVSGNQIKVIEGNKGNAVSYRYITVGNGNIRGYARPKYTGSSTSTPSTGKSVEEVAREVLAGKWGNGDDRKNRLEAAGYNYLQVQAKVNELSTPTTSKSIEQVAKEVLAGTWGNGDDRKNRLEAAGYNYLQVQAKVNELSTPTTSKSIEQVAKEVLAGTWGNGDDRKNRLTAAGYDYNAVQAKVNELSGSSIPSAPAVDPKKELVKAGQQHLNNFCGAGLTIDGSCGSATVAGIIKGLQTACNLDYGEGLKVDGIWGRKTANALGNHYVQKGETQYLVTFVEAALYCRGYNPNGCESPGTFGSGCQNAVIQFQKANGLTPDGVAGKNTILKLCGR